MQTRIDASKLELTETIVDIRRVAKTVKGGRNMRFSVTVVVGDGEGHVGMGLGKAIEIPEAVRKVLIMPSAKGTGVIAGSSVRTVLEAAGIKDVRAKSLGTSNTGNMARATMEGLKNLTTVEEVAKRRGKTPEEIIG